MSISIKKQHKTTNEKRLHSIDIDVNKYRKILDEMAETVLTKIKLEKSADEIIKVINDYLFRELAFAGSPNTDNPKDLFLNSVLDRKKGYCLGLSILYLCISERIGLHLYGVSLPKHKFVRYDHNTTRINIETLDQGMSYSDSHYITQYKVSGNDPYFMRNLNKQQVIGNFMSNIAVYYVREEMLDKALSIGKKALVFNPKDPIIHFNLGTAFHKQGKLNEAITEYRKALSGDPDSAEVHHNLGKAYIDKGMTEEAINEYERAIAIRPDYAVVYNDLAVTYYAKEEFDLANAYLDKAIKLGYNVNPQFIALLSRYRKHETKKTSDSNRIGRVRGGEAVYVRLNADGRIIEKQTFKNTTDLVGSIVGGKIVGKFVVPKGEKIGLLMWAEPLPKENPKCVNKYRRGYSYVLLTDVDQTDRKHFRAIWFEPGDYLWALNVDVFSLSLSNDAPGTIYRAGSIFDGKPINQDMMLTKDGKLKVVEN